MPTVKRLNEATVLVTGGSSGIGLETAAQFLAAGVPRLLLNGRDPGRGEAAAQRLRALHPQSDIHFVAADVTQPDSAQALVDAAVERCGGLDVLVNAAGGDHAPQLLHEIPLADIQPILLHFVSGALLCCRAALPVMAAQGGGAIVNVASDAAKLATPGESVIGAAMAAIVMFTRTLAIEGKRVGVRANALTPSIVGRTRTYDRVMATDFSRKLFSKAEKAAHLGVAQPEDQAALVVFLASPAAARLTGQAISVNGGISAA